jgi:valyl-tRNA synthetase
MEISKKKLANRDFLNEAPPHIVENVKEKAQHMSMKLEKLHQNLTILEGPN